MPTVPMTPMRPLAVASMVLEEGGYAAMPGPFLFSSVLAASALKLSGSEELKAKWLTPLAEGKAIGTVAAVESAGSIDARDISAIAIKGDGGWHLEGTKMFVPYANVADFIVVAAKRDSDIRLFVVDTKSPGVTIRSLKNLDLTRRVTSVELRNVPAERLHGDHQPHALFLCPAPQRENPLTLNASASDPTDPGDRY